MKMSTLALALVSGAVLASPVLAQSNPGARPAAQAPAGGNTLALGGGGSGGARKPILTREELRACLNNEVLIRNRIGEHEGARGPLDQERDQIAVEQEALKAERVKVDEVVVKAAAFKAKIEAHSERVKAWNEEVAKFNERPPHGQAGERARLRINQEREALQKAQVDFEAERAQLQSGTALVDAYDVKSKALLERVGGWNQRNSAWNEAGRKLEEERLNWVDECADRRYREDDELAIKAGR